MAKLRIEIDLAVGKIPTYSQDPDELPSLLREIADKLDNLEWNERDYANGDRMSWRVRSFESIDCGFVDIR